MNMQTFWSRVHKGDDCWEWLGAVNPAGYGHLKLDGELVRAHRVSWEFYNGPIQDNLWVLHRCDNRRCVNPGHLWLGTALDNSRDCIAKGRDRKALGSSNAKAKLTESEVISIRERAAAGIANVRLAEEYGVSRVLVSKIVRRVIWKQVEPACQR